MTDRLPLRYAILVPLAAALVAHSLVYNFVCDDAFISFVYARNLAEHGQLVFNLGDRVEGYTNFLWTVILGGLMKVRLQPELTSRVLGTLFGVGTMALAARTSERVRGAASAWDFLPPALLAASSGFACWSSGGLETQLFTFLATLGVLFYVGERWDLSGAAFALTAMTRPEGGLIFAVAVLHRLAVNLVGERRLLPNRRELAWGGWFLALYVPYFVWRWSYYGWPFPNTFYVKATGGGAACAGIAPNVPSPAAVAKYRADMLKSGLTYVWQWGWQSKAVLAAPLCLLGAVRRPRYGSFVLLMTVVYLAYVVKIGGDFMGLHRFVMPLFVTTAILASIGLEELARLVRLRAAGPILAAAVLGLFVWSQVGLTKRSLEPTADHGIDRPGFLKRYAENRGAIGKALAAHLTDEDFSVVGGAGVQPYYARMRAVDVYGLVSEPVAHCEPPTRARPGHQKWARPELLLARYQPTFIFHCYSVHARPDDYRLCADQGAYAAAGFVPQTIFVDGLGGDNDRRSGAGMYYTFLRRKDRAWH